MRVGWEAAAAFALLASGCALGRGPYAVDSIDEGRAVLVGEGGEVRVVEASELPPGAGEGDVLVDFETDARERERLLLDLRERRGRLLRRSGGEATDLTLEGP